MPVGVRPVHIYALPEDNSVWTHSDGEGTFDGAGPLLGMITCMHAAAAAVPSSSAARETH